MKLTVLSFCFLLLSCTALSQIKFMQSIGATASFMTATFKTNTTFGSVENQSSIVHTNFTYFPRLNLIEKTNSSISVGAPLSVGIGLYNNTFIEDQGLGFSYDIPIVFDYNLGCKSTKTNEKNFGSYFGLGFGYHSVTISGSEFSDFKGSSYGPIIRSGIRFTFDKPNWKGKAVTFGGYFKKGLEKAKFSSFGLNALVDL